MKRKIIKLFSLLLCAALILTLPTACGKADVGPEPGDDPADETSAAEETPEVPASEPEATPTPEPEETPEPEPEATPAPGSTLAAVPSASGRLHVEGTQLTDENGDAVQLRGVSTHGLAWFPAYVNEDCFRQLRYEWGANAVRLAMYTAESGGYCTDGDKDSLRALIRSGVDYATAQDMYVIIDWHILSDGDPTVNIDEARVFWDEISAEYADHVNVLYEICNEPNGGAGWDRVKSYAEQIIGIIRQNDENAVILVGTPNWCQYVDQAAADPLTGFDNIMYTLHFYAATHKDELRAAMASAMDGGLPIFVSEFGICDASGNGALDIDQANAWVVLMDARGVSYMNWSLCNKDESASILRSDCEKTSDFTTDDLSISGRWLYETLSGQTLEPLPPSALLPAGSGYYEFGDLSVTVVLKSSWETNGFTFHQYGMTVTNNGSTATERWSVEIPFNQTFSMPDFWCGDFYAKGTTLQISSMEYNAVLEPGASVDNLGCIVSGDSDLGIVIEF